MKNLVHKSLDFEKSDKSVEGAVKGCKKDINRKHTRCG